MCYLTLPVPLPSHIKVSAPLIIITCIFHSVFVTLKTNFRLSIKCSPLTATGNMDYILTLQHLLYRMNIRLYSTALWYTSKLFEIWTHDELIAETPILPELYLQLLLLSMLIFLTSCALLWLTSVQIRIGHEMKHWYILLFLWIVYFVLQVNVLKFNVGGTMWKLFLVVYIVYVTLY